MKRIKLQTLYKLLWVVFAAVSVSCNDTLNKVGFSVQPQDDRVSVGTHTLRLSSQTVQVDSIFSRTQYPILGEYIDPVFGSIRSEYVGEFFYPEGQGFMKGAEIDSVRLTVSYTSILGDSLTPMGLSVYRVSKPLPRNNDYTNFDPKICSDMSAPLGTQIFTGKNNTYRTETYYTGSKPTQIKIYEIHTRLPQSIGESFLSEYKKTDRGAFKNADTFRSFFPGLYITTDFGNSTILNINLTSLSVFYKYLDPKGSSEKQDTIRSKEFRLNITPEVTQINHISNNNEGLLDANDKGTFVKSPAGVNTQIHFPISKILSELPKSSLNQARLVVYALPEPSQDDMVKLSPPDQLLLVHKDSVKTFFENRRLPDNVTSYVASFNKDTYSYNFGNVAAMINYYKKKYEKAAQEPKDQIFFLVPVDVTFTKDQYGQNSTPTAVYNQMKPSAVMLENKPEKLKLDIIYSSF